MDNNSTSQPDNMRHRSAKSENGITLPWPLHEDANAIFNETNARMVVIRLMAQTYVTRQEQLDNIRVARAYLDQLEKTFIYLPGEP